MSARLKIAELTASRDAINSYEEARLIINLDQSDKITTKLANDFMMPGVPYTKYIPALKRHIKINAPEKVAAEWTAKDQSVTEAEYEEYVEAERHLASIVDVDNPAADMYLVSVGENYYEDSWHDSLGLVTSLEEAYDLVEELGYDLESIGYMSLCSNTKVLAREIKRTDRNIKVLGA